MSEKILPVAVGRMDDVVEAIREGNADRAEKLLNDEYRRRAEKADRLRAELDREMEFLYQVGRIRDYALSESTGGSRLLSDEWNQLRRECGWSGEVIAVDPAMPGEDITVVSEFRLDAATLPVGTVMVLGGTEFTLAFNERQRLTFNMRIAWGLDTIKFSEAEIQELIDRGVEFRLPEAKP